MGIATCYEWKPLLTGKDLMASLGVKGPALGTAVDMVMRWQLRNPQGTREEAEEYIKGAWGSGK